jgi:hypothetical protein
MAAAATLCLTLAMGGCMMGGPMASLALDEDVTGSIRASAPPPAASPLPALGADDWALASKALASALDPQGPGAAVLWENTASGARGSITPVGLVYASDGQTCRAFLAEIAGAAAVQRLQGRGCREGQGGWAVSDLKPFGS